MGHVHMRMQSASLRCPSWLSARPGMYLSCGPGWARSRGGPSGGGRGYMSQERGHTRAGWQRAAGTLVCERVQSLSKAQLRVFSSVSTPFPSNGLCLSSLLRETNVRNFFWKVRKHTQSGLLPPAPSVLSFPPPAPYVAACPAWQASCFFLWHPFLPSDCKLCQGPDLSLVCP